jgi:hypothetical protein
MPLRLLSLVLLLPLPQLCLLLELLLLLCLLSWHPLHGPALLLWHPLQLDHPHYHCHR